jgi:hypothetical protein
MAAATTSWAGQLRSFADTRAVALSPETVCLLFFNLLDGIFTLIFLQLGVATELNPLMRSAYELSPLVFMVAKLAVVSGGLLLLCLHRGTRLARWATMAGAVLYAAIVAYHLTFLWAVLH